MAETLNVEEETAVAGIPTRVSVGSSTSRKTEGGVMPRRMEEGMLVCPRRVFGNKSNRNMESPTGIYMVVAFLCLLFCNNAAWILRS